ncbi:MAG TPA: alpha/beta hydrolase [Puia sp.]|jgi:acetyl esterase/lipase
MSRNSDFRQPIDLPDDPYLSKAVKQFLALLNENWPLTESLSAERVREVFAAAQSAVTVDLSGITESQKIISCDGSNILLNIVRPEGPGGSLPVFLFIHGGGWVFGDYPTHKRMVRDLVVLTGFAAVFINYTRSPEAKYPQALNEIHAASKWISEHGKEIGVDPERIGIVGNGAGANMSAATTFMARANGGPQFKIQVLMWPVTNAEFDTRSWKRFGRQRFLTEPLITWMWDQYTTDPAQRKEIYASPLQATTEQLKGLPPTLILVAGNDILRDDGEAFGRALDDAGVTVTTVRYNGVIHDFGLLNGLADLPQTKSLFIQAAAELKSYLG